MAKANKQTMLPNTNRQVSNGRLPDPGTGSRGNGSAAPEVVDDVTAWATKWDDAPFAPRIPTNGDLNASGAFGRQ